MKLVLNLVSIIIVCSLCYVSNVDAFGLGVTSTIGTGTAKHTYESNTYNGIDTEYKYDTSRASIGIVMDTNLSKDKLFNYRLGMVYESEEFDRSGFKYQAKGGSIENDFGFGIIRNDLIRLWVGPELRLTYLEKKWDNNSTTSLFEFGLGPVVGVNFNLGPVVTISAKTGYIFNGTGGIRSNNASNSYNDTDIKGSGNYPIFNLSLLFRIGEK